MTYDPVDTNDDGVVDADVNNQSVSTDKLYTKGRSADVIVANDDGVWRAMGDDGELASGSDGATVVNQVLNTDRHIAVVDDVTTDTTVTFPGGRGGDNRGGGLEHTGIWTYTGTGAAFVLGKNTIFTRLLFNQIKTANNSGAVAIRHKGAEWNVVEGRIIGGENTADSFSTAGIQYDPDSNEEADIGGHNYWRIQRIDGNGITDYGIHLKSNSGSDGPSSDGSNVQGSKFLISVVKKPAVAGVQDGETASDRTHKFSTFRLDVDDPASGGKLMDLYGSQNEYILTGYFVSGSQDVHFRTSAENNILKTPNEPPITDDGIRNGKIYSDAVELRNPTATGAFAGIDSDGSRRGVLSSGGTVGDEVRLTSIPTSASGANAGQTRVQADDLHFIEVSGTEKFAWGAGSNDDQHKVFDGEIRNSVAGNGFVVTTPDGTAKYRIRVDNSGNVVTDQL